MPDELLAVANSADAIIDGYAFTLQDDHVRVLKLSHPESACVLDVDGRMIETTMDDIEQELVSVLYRRNSAFLGA